MKPRNAALAAMLIGTEMEKVDLQFSRIRNDRQQLTDNARILQTSMNEASMGAKEDALDKCRIHLFADIHYLLISLNNIDSLLCMLEKALPGYPEVSAVRKKHEHALFDYDKFRNNFEHIYDRVNEGVMDLGTLSGDQFTFNRETFNIGEDRKKEVEAIYDDIKSALLSVIEKQAVAKREGGQM